MLPVFFCALSFVPPAPLPLQTACEQRPSLEVLGLGTPGTAGFALVRPTLGPFVGEPSAFAVEGGSPGAAGALFASPLAADPPVPLPGFGSTWFLGAPLVAENFVFDVEGCADGLFAQASVDPSLCGQSAWLQAIQFDAAATGGLAFTPGLAVRFGVRRGPLFDAPLYAVSESTSGTALADFDGDGFVDAAVADRMGGEIAVLSGRGDGNFLEGPRTFVGGEPSSPVVGDLDGDGRLDLVLFDPTSDLLQVLLGNGDGTFFVGLSVATGADTVDLELAELDGDGRLDVVVLDRTEGVCRVWLGLGDGTLVPAPSVSTGPDPRALAIGDVDLDGRPDLLVAAHDANSVFVHHGAGDGTFVIDLGLDVHFAGWLPTSLELGDLDADGRPDLVLGVCCDSLAVLLGKGPDGFVPPVAYLAVRRADELALGDLDGDGALDVFAASAESGRVGVLRGLGDGGLGPFERVIVGVVPSSPRLADLDGDGLLDATYTTLGRFGVLLAQPGQGPVGPTPLGDTVRVSDVALADLDGDGFDDLVTVADGFPPVTCEVRLGLGDGSFGPPDVVPFGKFLSAVVAVDLDADGVLDLAVANENIDALEVALGLGDGTFAAPVAHVVGNGPKDVAAGDLDGDGLLDLACTNFGSDEVSLLFATAPGVFAPAVQLPAGVRPRAVALADLDADGDLDLIATNGSPQDQLPSTVRDALVWLNPGDGSFANPLEVEPGGHADRLLVVDVNADGVLDLVVADFGGTVWLFGGVRVHLGAGDGTFPTTEAYDTGLNTLGLAVADLDLDGIVDLVVGEAEDVGTTGGQVTPGGRVLVHPGNPPGSASLFGAPAGFATGRSTTWLGAFDLDRDGLPDVLALDGDPLALFGRLAD